MKSTFKTTDCGVCRLFASPAGLDRAALAIAVLVCSTALAEADTCTWIGNTGTQDWSTSSNWQNGKVPTGDDVAYFPYKSTAAGNVTNFLYSVTPDADFTGTIAGQNDKSYTSVRFPTMLKLGVTAGASWSVTGDVSVVATDGIAERLGNTFTGTLDVRKGMSVALPASLPSCVKVIGAGTVTLRAASQMANVSQFAGSVVLPNADVEVSSASLLAGHGNVLQNGRTLSLDGHDSALANVSPIASFTDDASAWTFNGSVVGTDPFTDGDSASTAPPYVENGTLVLTDDPAQLHTVWYNKRVFRSTDVWGMSFTYNPALPADSHVIKAGRRQTRSSSFAILFQTVSPENVSTSLSEGRDGIFGARTYGFRFYVYRDGGKPHVGLVAEGATKLDTHIREIDLDGIVLYEPIDFTVSCEKGLVVVTMSQNGKSVSLAHSFETAFSVRGAAGMFVGFGGASDTWGNNDVIPWCRHEIGNFSGWVRDSLAGGWKDVENSAAFSTLTADNYYVLRKNRASGSETSTDSTPACYNSDGTIPLVDAEAKNGSVVISKATVTVGKTYTVHYDIQAGSASVSGSDNYGMGFLFGGKNGQTYKMDWSYGYDFGNWKYGFGLNWNLREGVAQLKYDHFDTKTTSGNTYYNSGAAWSVSRSDSSKGLANITYSADFIYDTTGNWTGFFTQYPPRDGGGNGYNNRIDYTINSATLADYTGTYLHSGRNVSVGIRAAAGSTSNYQQLTLTGIKVRELAAAEAGLIGGELRVPGESAATLKVGDRMEGQTSRVATVASLVLENGAALTVAPETSATTVGIEFVKSTGRTTLAAANGADVEVEALSLGGAAGSSALVATGATFPADLVVTIPDAWTRMPQKSVGRHEIALAAGFPATARIVTDGGEDVTDAAHLSVGATGSATIDFTTGFVMVIR